MIVPVKSEPKRPTGRAVVLGTVSCVLAGLAVGNIVGVILFSLTFILFKASA
ncbi:MAG: hypothetical protein ACI9BW_003464 [Gammaproteobacteria bacterium]|jgi:hypothetical protein